jgi:hypothetical protein
LVKGLPSPPSSGKLQLLGFPVTTSFRKLLDDYIFFSSIHKNKLKIGKEKTPKPLD